MSRAPLKVSREMKLLLLLLLMVALIGAWYIWTNNRNATNELPQSTAVPGINEGNAGPDAAGTSGPGASSSGTNGFEAGGSGTGAGNTGAGNGTPTDPSDVDTVPLNNGSSATNGAASGSGETGTPASNQATASGSAGTNNAANNNSPSTTPPANGTSGDTVPIAPTSGGNGIAQPGAGKAATGTDAVATAPAGSSADISNNGVLGVQPNQPVDIEVIPPFPTPEVGQDGTDAGGTATPSGINPQASVAAVPRNNPFRPLTLTPTPGDQTTPTDISAGGDTGSRAPTASAGGQDSVQTGPITPGNAGPLTTNAIPGANGTTSSNFGGNTFGGSNSLPSIPGANGSTSLTASGTGNPGLNNPGTSNAGRGNGGPAGTNAVANRGNGSASLNGTSGTSSGSAGTVSGGTPGRTIAGNSSDSGVSVVGSSRTGGGAAGTGASGTPGIGSAALVGGTVTQGNTAQNGVTQGSANQSNSGQGNVNQGSVNQGSTNQGNAGNGQANVVITAPKPPRPVAPPIAGVNVPSVNRVPVTGSRPTAPATSAAGTSGAATSGITGASSAGTRPTPGTPQVITSLGQDASASAANEISKLDQFVQDRQLAFNAAVLGPINTAIFQGKDGYVVVAVGQNLPDSAVTLREVSATRAVLSLGNDLKTLELDQR
ncbi:beta strand repeat-containing protein [Deinococcus arenicola]|uniref:SPOR domain-containing protein n=1 Tax=Deinococcus arenicola TaxID=2994950 RepID=A0ABU4DR85_9DEIO|nr:hypothetical protein [Deinococcus sp. ZS9-10]MDV6374951.1 hypothetical protein [Deinococcus sp. ZS9-10]